MGDLILGVDFKREKANPNPVCPNPIEIMAAEILKDEAFKDTAPSEWSATDGESA